MSPVMGDMLVHDVMPRLRAAARSIPKTGCEDDEEIVQDATLMAARMMESAEQAGQRFSASNIAYYATRAARSGRRSYYTGHSDVMSAGCLLDGGARHESLDDEIDMESLEAGTLHDIIAPPGYQGRESDPSEEAARNIDWAAYLAGHPPRHRAASLKRRIAGDLLEFFGLDVIRRLLGGCRPDWESGLRMTRERHLHLCDVGCGLDVVMPEPC